MKVLMSCYACDPGKGSEPGVGWNWALQASRVAEVWVLTRATNRPTIEAELARQPVPNLHFVYHDLPHWARFWQRGERGIRFYYVLWQLTALSPAYFLHRQVELNIVHHITFNSIDLPGFLWLLGPRFVWGPVGGAQTPPETLKRYFGGQWRKEQARALRKRLLRLNPIVRLAIRRAHCILAANADTEHALRRLGAKRLVRVLEAGIYRDSSARVRCRGDRSGRPFTVIWAGRLILLKAPNLAIDVVEELVGRNSRVHLLMIGDGPVRPEIEHEICTRGLESFVTMVGAVTHHDMPRWYAQGDVFLFTSLRDTSGNVVLEAMSHGLPVITLDHQGAADMVTSECGFKIAIGTPSEVVRGMANAIETLARSPDLYDHMSAAARQRADTAFSWDRKGDLLQEIYAEVSL